MVGNQKSHRITFENLDRKPEFVRVIRRGGNHFDQTAAVFVNPAAGIRADFECRGNSQELPRAADFHEDSLAVTAEEAEVAVTGG